MYNYILLCHFVPFFCNLCKFIPIYLDMASHFTLLWLISPRDIANINFFLQFCSLKKKEISSQILVNPRHVFVLRLYEKP